MPTVQASRRWARPTLAAVAVVVMPVIVLGMGAADAPLIHSQELPWMPADPSLRLLAYAHNSGLDEPERMVLRSPDEWAAVWTSWEAPAGVKTDPPAVDFEAEMVLVAALGTRPTMSRIVVIDSVTETKNELVVHVRTLSGAFNCVALPMITEPAVAVAAPARSKPVRFVDRVQRSDCD